MHKNETESELRIEIDRSAEAAERLADLFEFILDQEQRRNAK